MPHPSEEHRSKGQRRRKPGARSVIRLRALSVPFLFSAVAYSESALKGGSTSLLLAPPGRSVVVPRVVCELELTSPTGVDGIDLAITVSGCVVAVIGYLLATGRVGR